VKPKLGSRSVVGVTHEDLERHVTTLDASDNTKKVVARTLHALFAFAITPKKLRLDNPAHGLLKALKNPDADRDEVALDPNDHRHYFMAEESRVLLAKCREANRGFYGFVLVALQTGMRLGEIRALRFDRVNWHGGYITVDQAFVRGRLTSPKNGKSRTVSLSRDLRAELGSYHIAGRIGAGGMGEVYRARDLTLDRDVAIIVLPDAFAQDPEGLQRLEREAKTLAALNHPNIAQIRDRSDVSQIEPFTFLDRVGKFCGWRSVIGA
jgi:integrase